MEQHPPWRARAALVMRIPSRCPVSSASCRCCGLRSALSFSMPSLSPVSLVLGIASRPMQCHCSTALRPASPWLCFAAYAMPWPSPASLFPGVDWQSYTVPSRLFPLRFRAMPSPCISLLCRSLAALGVAFPSQSVRISASLFLCSPKFSLTSPFHCFSQPRSSLGLLFFAVPPHCASIQFRCLSTLCESVHFRCMVWPCSAHPCRRSAPPSQPFPRVALLRIQSFFPANQSISPASRG